MRLIKVEKAKQTVFGLKKACIHIHFGRIFQGYESANGFFWFRVFGYGIKGKNANTHRLLFSERYGTGLRVGKWYFGLLKKNRM